MRQVILFIATSLDGYIARKDGGIDWLFTDDDYNYNQFYQSIDTTLMGYKTYEKILELEFDDFPYSDKINYVFTRNQRQKDNNTVFFISTNLIEFVKQLKQAPGENIWLVGGGQINSLLLKENLIDEIIISIHPTILGEGIPLFSANPREKSLKLINQQSFKSGLIQINYKINNVNNNKN